MRRLRVAALMLGALAAAKVGTQEYLYRSGTQDVLISAYRDRAIQACQKLPRSQGMITNTSAWSKPIDVRVVIGKSELDVWFWQVDSSLWEARYRNPYLYLANGDRLSSVTCEYDIVHGIASASRN